MTTKDEDIRMVFVGTVNRLLDTLRLDRPDLDREEVLLVRSVKDLDGHQFRRCTVVRTDGHPDSEQLAALARDRRTLPAFAAKRTREQVREQYGSSE